MVRAITKYEQGGWATHLAGKWRGKWTFLQAISRRFHREVIRKEDIKQRRHRQGKSYNSPLGAGRKYWKSLQNWDVKSSLRTEQESLISYRVDESVPDICTLWTMQFENRGQWGKGRSHGGVLIFSSKNINLKSLLQIITINS